MSAITNINIETYSERAIVVRGNTEDHKEQLKALGGKWNSRLKDGPGWIFPKTKKQEIENWIATRQLPVGTIVKAAFYQEENISPRQSSSISITESQMLREIKNLNIKVDRLENLIKKLISKHNDICSDNEEEKEEEKEEEEEEDNNINRKRLLK